MRKGRSQRRLRKLHRWLGLVAALLIAVLALTGIALNHSAEWSLDRQFVRNGLLLDWYGIGAPPVSASYVAADRRLTLMGDRLYLDDTEVGRGFDRLLGAASSQGEIVALVRDAVLFIGEQGRIVDRLDVSAGLPAGLDGMAAADDGLYFRRGDRYFPYDPGTLAVSAVPAAADGARDLEPVPLPPDALRQIESRYRGAGLSLERVLLDLHSGRLLTAGDGIVADVMGLVLLLVAGSGIYIWIRR